MGQIELQNGVDIKEKTQPNETENKVCEEEKKVDVAEAEDVKEVDVKEVERLVEEVEEIKRKSFPNEKEKLIEIVEKAKIQDNEKPENLEKEEIIDETYDRKETELDDKDSLITNDKVDSETHEISVSTV